MQVMETRKRVLGPEHPDTRTSMNNLAPTFWGQYQKNQAIQLMAQVVQCCQEQMCSGHPNTTRSTNTLQQWRDQMEY